MCQKRKWRDGMDSGRSPERLTARVVWRGIKKTERLAGRLVIAGPRQYLRTSHLYIPIIRTAGGIASRLTADDKYAAIAMSGCTGGMATSGTGATWKSHPV